jgi:hypothetical protein
MRWTKALSLAAMAAVAAMAFIGTGTASAQNPDPEIVLCKALELLCAPNNLWPADTVLLALAANALLDNGVVHIECEDSVVNGLVTTPGGIGTDLHGVATTVSFGKLPTPTLGEGCVSDCGASIQVHINGTPLFLLEVATGNVYKFTIVTGKATILCAGFSCGFAANNDSGKISHTGTHSLHSGNNLPLIDLNVELERTLGLAFSCGGTAVWDADYVVYLAHANGQSGLAWPALDKKA